MNQNLFIDMVLKGENYEKIYYPKMFSAKFENIKQLQSFLKLSSYLVCVGNVCETLGLNCKLFKSIKKGG